MVKRWKILEIELIIEFIKKHEDEEMIKQHSKLTFIGIHKSYEIYDSFRFKHNEKTMDKRICLGFAVLELSKLFLVETYYDKFQPCFRQENLQTHYMDCDSFVLRFKTQDIIENLKNLKDLFDFSNLIKGHRIFSDENKKVVGKFKIETPDNI